MQKKRITIFTGPFGSGKTEVAVNYALKLNRHQPNNGLVDLDIVNPYFRSRELIPLLGKHGIELVSTQPGLEMADLPALSPRIFALLQNEKRQVIFDVGGDPVGAKTLGRFQPYFTDNNYDLWLVLNPYRPGYSDPAKIARLAGEIENASRLKITGLVDNANMGKLTNRQLRAEGSLIVDAAARLLNVPVVLTTFTEDDFFLHEQEEEKSIYLKLFMLPPWEVI